MKNLFLFIITLCVISCNEQNSNTPEIAIEVFTNQGKLITKISDESEITIIRDAWLSKQKAVFKQMPVFDSYIVFPTESGTEQWLFSKPNLIKSDKKGADTIYRLSFKSKNPLISQK
jgi:hypothetical protein